MNNFFRNLKIGTKVSILVVLPLIFMGGVIALGLNQVHGIGKELKIIVNEDIPLLKRLNRITFNSLEKSVHFECAKMCGKLITQDKMAKKKFESERDDFMEHGRKIEEEVKKGRVFIERISKKLRDRKSKDIILKIDYELRNIHKEHAENQFLAERVFNFFYQGKIAEAEETIEIISKKRAEETGRLTENFFLAIEEFVEYSTMQAKDRERTAFVGMSAISALILFISLVLGIYMSRLIRLPIIQLTNTTKLIADGDLSQKIDISSNDEIGDLVNSFNKMAEGLSVSIQKEKDLAAAAAAADVKKKKAEELHTANQQLRASEQQLQASNQQLRAANQQLGAKEQALRESQEVLKSKMADLERFNKLMVGRELDMVKLKGEVNSLLEKSGETKKYNVT